MTRPTWLKALVALVGALATWGVTASEDGAYSQPELWGALLAVVTAAGVYLAKNGAQADPSTSTPEPPGTIRLDGGQAGLDLLVQALVVVLLVGLVVWVFTALI